MPRKPQKLTPKRIKYRAEAKRKWNADVKLWQAKIGEATPIGASCSACKASAGKRCYSRGDLKNSRPGGGGFMCGYHRVRWEWAVVLLAWFTWNYAVPADAIT